jgi:putative membrane protein
VNKGDNGDTIQTPAVKTRDAPTAVNRDTAAAAELRGERHLLATSARRLHRTPWRVVAGRIVVNAIAVALVELILPGVHLSAAHPVLAYLVTGVILSFINAFLKPAIQFVALPLLLGSMGLVVIVVDVVVFVLLDLLTPVLHSDGLVWDVVAGLLLGLLSYLLDNLAGLTPPIMPDRPEEGR